MSQNKREYDRLFKAAQKAAMTPEELDAHTKKKAAYDKIYRAKHAAKRKAYNQDPKRRAKWSALTKIKYRAKHPKPVWQTPEERKRRRLLYAKKYHAQHPAYRRNYYYQNRAAILTQKSSYQKINAKRIREVKKLYRKRRMEIDPVYRMAMVLRGTIQRVLKYRKAYKAIDLIGCTRDQLRAHLESKFTKDMGWHNYGRNGWEVDHIIPVTKFDLTDPAEQKRCFHFSNLQPLMRLDNLRKGNRIIDPQPCLLL